MNRDLSPETPLVLMQSSLNLSKEQMDAKGVFQ